MAISVVAQESEYDRNAHWPAHGLTLLFSVAVAMVGLLMPLLALSQASQRVFHAAFNLAPAPWWRRSHCAENDTPRYPLPRRALAALILTEASSGAHAIASGLAVLASRLILSRVPLVRGLGALARSEIQVRLPPIDGLEYANRPVRPHRRWAQAGHHTGGGVATVGQAPLVAKTRAGRWAWR